MAQNASERTFLGKIGHTLGTGERLGVQAAMMPQLRALNPSAYEALQQRGGDIYAGDVLRTGWPEIFDQPNIGSKLAAGLGGIAVGTVIDPLSILGLGGLSKLGHADAAAGTLGKSLTQQASKGQRALIGVRKLFDESGSVIPLIRGDGPITGAPFRAIDAIREGRGTQAAVDFIGRMTKTQAYLNAPGQGYWIKEAAKGWDGLVNRFLQDFGSGIGVHPGVFQGLKNLYAKTMGHTGQFTRDAAYNLEPSMDNLAQTLAEKLQIDPKKAREITNKIVLDYHTQHPYIDLVKQNNDFKFVTRNVPKTEYDRALAAVQKHLNVALPPSFGGPPSLLDNAFLRNLREASNAQKEMYQRVLHLEGTVLGKTHQFWSHPDAGYSPVWVSEEFQKAQSELLQQVYRKPGSKLGDKGKFPWLTHPHMKTRLYRTVDPLALEEMATSFSSAIPSTFKYQGEVIDWHKELASGVGGFITPKQFTTARWLRRQIDSFKNPQDVKAGYEVLRKLLPTPTIAERNDIIFTKGFEIAKGVSIPPGTIRDAFVEDPVAQFIHRGSMAGRSVSSHDFFDFVKNSDIALPVGTLPADKAHWIESNVPGLKGYALDPDVAKYLNRQLDREVNLPKSMELMLRGLNKANQHFKAWTLGLFPSYHIRNFMGDMHNYWLASDSPTAFFRGIKDSTEAFNAIRANRQHLITTPNGVLDAREIWKEADKLNAWGVGFASPHDPAASSQAASSIYRGLNSPLRIDDPEQFVYSAYKNSGALKAWGGIVPMPPKEALRASALLDHRNWYIESGFRVGQMVSDRVRMAHILQKVRQGYSVEDAVVSAKKVLFDYHDLSPVERKLWREIFPFYSWTRKNIPNIMHHMIVSPDKVARFHGGVRGFQGPIAPEDERYLNGWMEENYPLRIRKNKNGQYEYLMLKNWLPLVDIQELASAASVGTMVQSSLTPFMKVPMELASNFNYFTGRKIDNLSRKALSLGTERTRYFSANRALGVNLGPAGEGVMVPNKVAHILKSVRPVDILHQIIDNPQDMDNLSRMLKVTLGRTYPLDTRKGLFQIEKDLDELNRDTNRAVKGALLKHEPGEARRYQSEGLKQVREYMMSHGLAR